MDSIKSCIDVAYGEGFNDMGNGATEELKEFYRFLKELEWCVHGSCPVCNKYKGFGHEENCKILTYLKEE